MIAIEVSQPSVLPYFIRIIPDHIIDRYADLISRLAENAAQYVPE